MPKIERQVVSGVVTPEKLLTAHKEILALIQNKLIDQDNFADVTIGGSDFHAENYLATVSDMVSSARIFDGKIESFNTHVLYGTEGYIETVVINIPNEIADFDEDYIWAWDTSTKKFSVSDSSTTLIDTTLTLVSGYYQAEVAISAVQVGFVKIKEVVASDCGGVFSIARPYQLHKRLGKISNLIYSNDYTMRNSQFQFSWSSTELKSAVMEMNDVSVSAPAFSNRSQINITGNVRDSLGDVQTYDEATTDIRKLAGRRMSKRTRKSLQKSIKASLATKMTFTNAIIFEIPTGYEYDNFEVLGNLSAKLTDNDNVSFDIIKSNITGDNILFSVNLYLDEDGDIKENDHIYFSGNIVCRFRRKV